MVATIPTWVTIIVKQDELDIAPKGGSEQPRPERTTSADGRRGAGQSAADAKAALQNTNEEHLKTKCDSSPGARSSWSCRATRCCATPSTTGAPPRPDDRLSASDGRRVPVITDRRPTTRSSVDQSRSRPPTGRSSRAPACGRRREPVSCSHPPAFALEKSLSAVCAHGRRRLG